MKVGILTFHRAINYGAVLQAWALQKKVKSMGCECDVLDYNSEQMKQYTAVINMFEKPKTLKSYLSAIVKAPFIILRKARFSNFVKKYLELTEKLNKDSIKKCEAEYDGVIVGSDQVWNDYLTGFDKAYFLDFIKEKRKWSYSVSLGFTEIPSHLRSEYHNLLSNFSEISMREQSAADIIEDLLERKVNICIDPTLLLDKIDWMSFIRNGCADQYILIYSLNKNIYLFQKAIQLAKKKGCKLYYICNDMRDIRKLSGLPGGEKVRYILSPTPVEFLNLIYHAQSVMTNSFHGTVFSLIFHKNFYCEAYYGDHQNNRIIELLENLDLSQRIVGSNFFYEGEIDWSIVDERLEREKEKSEKYLKTILVEKAV